MQTNAEHNNETELEREVEVNSRRVDFCTRAVVLALFFEAVVLWEYSGNKPLRETALFIACDLLLAVAIYGEITFGKKYSTAQSKLKRLSDQKVADAYLTAAEAQDRLSELLEWRKLDPEQTGRVAEKLRRFAGSQFDFGLHTNHPEHIQLGKCISDALKQAGWTEMDCETTQTFIRLWGPRVCIGASVMRVKILQRPERVKLVGPSLADAPQFLIEALAAEGIEASEAALIPFGAPPTQAEQATIRIMIGPKM